MAKTSNISKPALSEKEKRELLISTRLSPPEYDEVVRAALKSGEGKTEWIRKKLIAAARRA